MDGGDVMALILVVEDNLDYREVLVNFLESAEYRVMAAADGDRKSVV